MGNYIRSDYHAQAESLMQDDAQILDKTKDYEPALDRAISDYSYRKPLPRVIDLTSDGTGDIDVSTLPLMDEYIDPRLKIEWPISNPGEKPNVIPDTSWELYHAPTVANDGSTKLLIRFFNTIIPLGNIARFTYNGRHSVDISDKTKTTIPDSDFDTVYMLEAAQLCQVLVNHYNQSADKSQGADFVAFTTKSDQYAKRKRELTDAALKPPVGVFIA